MTETSLDFQELKEADRVVIRVDVQSSADLSSLRRWQVKGDCGMGRFASADDGFHYTSIM